MLRRKFSGAIQKIAPTSAPSAVEGYPAVNENNFFWKQAPSQAQCPPAPKTGPVYLSSILWLEKENGSIQSRQGSAGKMPQLTRSSRILGRTADIGPEVKLMT